VREKARPHGLHEEEPTRPGQGDQVASLGAGHGEGLLHQHGLVVFERQPGVGVVERVRGGHVDNVDLGVRDEFLVGPVTPVDPELLTKGVSCVEGPRSDGHDHALVSEPQVPRKGVSDSARSDDSPAQRWCHAVLRFVRVVAIVSSVSRRAVRHGGLVGSRRTLASWSPHPPSGRHYARTTREP
jgi:hypothetical protein